MYSTYIFPDDDQNDLHEVVLSAIYAFIVENEIMTVIIGSSVVAVLVGITICCVLKRKNKRKTTKLQGNLISWKSDIIY